MVHKKKVFWVFVKNLRTDEQANGEPSLLEFS